MARKSKKYHYIYKTTNLKNGKYYVGMHSTDNLEDGYLGSGKRLRRSLNKYGKENFKFEILEFLPDRLSLKEREKELVNEELIKDSLSMNLTIGGEGGFSLEQQKENAKKSNNKQRILRETNPDWVEKVRENKSNGHKLAYEKGRKKVLPNWKGKFHTIESKIKMSEVKKGKYEGENNPSYGTCWITNGKENKKIHRGDLIPDGWKLGRKIN